MIIEEDENTLFMYRSIPKCLTKQDLKEETKLNRKLEQRKTLIINKMLDNK